VREQVKATKTALDKINREMNEVRVAEARLRTKGWSDAALQFLKNAELEETTRQREMFSVWAGQKAMYEMPFRDYIADTLTELLNVEGDGAKRAFMNSKHTEMPAAKLSLKSETTVVSDCFDKFKKNVLTDFLRMR